MKSGIAIISVLLVALWMSGCAITVHNQEAEGAGDVAGEDGAAGDDGEASEAPKLAVGIKRPALAASGDGEEGASGAVGPKGGVADKEIMKKGEETDDNGPRRDAPEPQ